MVSNSRLPLVVLMIDLQATSQRLGESPQDTQDKAIRERQFMLELNTCRLLGAGAMKRLWNS